MKPGAWPRRFIRWFTSLPTGLLVALVGAVAVASVVGGVFLFRTYQYVQHDNEFCLSCHLMVEPYERFAQSGHRGLACKACHQPTLAVRTQMALAQVIERPEELHTHAEVPNARCVECHVDGDPERWRHIGNSIGHRVHFESTAPELQGLRCVQCHSSSVHEFAATSRTCGQAGCHEDTQVRLGRMGDFTIHCIACHDFSRPVDQPLAPAQLAIALSPRREDCMGCHQMRVLLADFPTDEPHDGACGVCHDPHAQTTPSQAVRTCAGAGCHARADTLTGFHRGLSPGVLDNCTVCHGAHGFRVDGRDCLACHGDVYGGESGSESVGESGSVHGAAVRLTRSGVTSPHGRVEGASRRATNAQQAPRTLRFRHAEHRGVECTQCHQSTRVHGELTIASLRDCRQCHHTAPVMDRCSRCHQPAEYAPRTYRVSQTFRLSVWQRQPRERALSFDHRRHEGIACVDCHTTPLTLSAVNVQCNACHEQHHRPNVQCIACHVAAPRGAHTREVHVTCTGAGCHSPVPAQVRSVPRTRNFCLTCHQGLTDHRPGRNCADCHALPAPQASAGEGQLHVALPGWRDR